MKIFLSIEPVESVGSEDEDEILGRPDGKEEVLVEFPRLEFDHVQKDREIAQLQVDFQKTEQKIGSKMPIFFTPETFLFSVVMINWKIKSE